MALILCIFAILISVAGGSWLKLNTGMIAMVSAFFIGHFFIGMDVEEIILLCPTNLIFYLTVISLLFNHAVINGSMEILSEKLLRLIGGKRILIPWAIMLVCALVGGLGAGASTPVIVGPFAFSIALSSGIDPLLTSIAICFGNLIGSNNPYNGYGGVISSSLISENGTAPELTRIFGNTIWLNCSMMCIVIVAAFFLRSCWIKRRNRPCKEEKMADRAMEQEGVLSFDKKQLATVVIIAASCVLMILPGFLSMFVESEFLSAAGSFLKPQVVMLCGALLCAALKLAPAEEVISRIPVRTILMITGMYVLIEVSVRAGFTELIAAILDSSIPDFLLPAALVLLAAALSFFSSTTSTVMPLMYPMVPLLAMSTGLSPTTLYSCIFFGGLSADISPFSTGGALTISGCPDVKIREKLVGKMVASSFAVSILVAISAQLGLFSIL